MSTVSPINASDIVDQSRLGLFQIFVLSLCGLCLIMDGFDVQAMSYVAPAVIKEWQVNKASLGPVFGAALFGMLIGSMVLGIIADKVGRRPVLIAAVLFIAGSMFVTARASSINELLVLRFVTGLGMGAIIPNAIALAGEYSPARMRVTLMMIISSGFIIGGALGGVVSAGLIPAFGWRSVFYVGAITPLVLGILMIFWLPESVQFLVLRGKNRSRLQNYLRRIAPNIRIAADAGFIVREQSKKGLPFVNLFRDRMATGTLLLWAINFMNMLCAYFLSAWLPVVMNSAGHSTSQAVLAGTSLWVGGIVGNWILGWVVDRRGFGPVLIPTFLTAAVAIAVISQVYGALGFAFAAIALAGFCVLGGQSALNALAATFYPTAVRSTGMGWALGLGRLGAIFGPVIGAELMRLEWSAGDLFLAAALPPIVALVATFGFWRLVTLSPRQSVEVPGRQALPHVAAEPSRSV